MGLRTGPAGPLRRCQLVPAAIFPRSYRPGFTVTVVNCFTFWAREQFCYVRWSMLGGEKNPAKYEKSRWARYIYVILELGYTLDSLGPSLAS